VARTFAKFSAPIMFPGIPDPQRAMELWEATHPDNGAIEPTMRHLKALDQAAIAHARQVGKPDNYFLNGRAYKEQRYHLRRRILERYGLGPLIRLRAHLANKDRRPIA
jgi:hypothetical protein